MATTQPCWRCLLRPSSHLNGLSLVQPRAAVLPNTTAAAFSTSIPRQALKLKKKKVERNKAKAPAPGERKALRKMIVLSNTNALQVPSVGDMTAENLSDPESRGTVLGIPDAIVSRLRAAETFQTKQRWRMFRRPSVVIRSVDVRLAQMMDDARDSKRVIRQVVVGERGSGKSLYLLQALASAMLKEWIVITIPEAQDLVNAHTDYAPIPSTRPVVYQQRTYTASLLQRMISANPQLADLNTTMEHQLPVSIPSSLSLSKLATLAINDPALAQPIFEAIMKELTSPGRPPILITLDGFNHINKLSAYRNPAFNLIHAHDIYLPAWFIAHLSGASPLPNGGAVLAAMTRSNAPHVLALDDRLAHLEKQQSFLKGVLELKAEESLILPYLKATGQEHLATQVPDLDPFVRYDTRVLEIFARTEDSPAAALPPPTSTQETPEGSSSPAAVDSLPPATAGEPASWSPLAPANSTVEIKRMTGLTKMEAKALMEYWALSGVLRAEVSERFVGQQWSVSGGGLPGELERGCLGMRF